jgi:hypothetical protein
VTDVQILTLALTLLGIFAASWFNNSRINDVKDVFRAELKALETGMGLQFERSNTRFERMDNKIDTLLKMVADIDTRVTALESRKL